MERPICFPRMGVLRMRRMSLQVRRNSTLRSFFFLPFPRHCFLFIANLGREIDIEEPRDAVLVTNGDSEIGQVAIILQVTLLFCCRFANESNVHKA